ncbi:hypothetical protein C3007_09840, partial [Avibacterium gallinarum]
MVLRAGQEVKWGNRGTLLSQRARLLIFKRQSHVVQRLNHTTSFKKPPVNLPGKSPGNPPEKRPENLAANHSSPLD